MIAKYLYFFLTVLSLSCKSQPRIYQSKETEEVFNAKWYFYSNAIKYMIYDKNGILVKPLSCEVRVLRESKINPDTTKIYLQMYYRDTLNECTLKPLGLTGITIVKNQIYIPIYHSVEISYQNENAILEEMKEKDLALKNAIVKESEFYLSNWVHNASKRKKILK